jgi:hypothetical protein
VAGIVLEYLVEAVDMDLQWNIKHTRDRLVTINETYDSMEHAMTQRSARRGCLPWQVVRAVVVTATVALGVGGMMASSGNHALERLAGIMSIILLVVMAGVFTSYHSTRRAIRAKLDMDIIRYRGRFLQALSELREVTVVPEDYWHLGALEAFTRYLASDSAGTLSECAQLFGRESGLLMVLESASILRRRVEEMETDAFWRPLGQR